MSIIQQIMNLPLFVKIAIVIAVYFMFFQKENFGPSNFDESPFVEINNKAVGLKPRPHHKGIRNSSVMKDRLMKPSKRVRIEPYSLNSIRKMQEKKIEGGGTISPPTHRPLQPTPQSISSSPHDRNEDAYDSKWRAPPPCTG